MDRHRPELPCWTLVSLGVLPIYQGQGHGSWMLKHVLRRLPADASVFLETYNPGNLRFYGARGFHVSNEFRADGGKGPQTWTMLRVGTGAALGS